MKTIFLLALLASSCFSLRASATTGHKIPNMPKAPTLRNVRVTGRISKFSITHEADKVGYHSEEICKFDTQLPLLDTRSFGVSWDYQVVADCPSTVNKQPVRVMVNAYAALSTWESIDGSKSDVKIAQSGLFVRDGGSGNAGVIDVAGYFGTKDLNTPSMLTFLAQTFQPGQPQADEQFSATFEIEDRQ